MILSVSADGRGSQLSVESLSIGWMDECKMLTQTGQVDGSETYSFFTI